MNPSLTPTYTLLRFLCELVLDLEAWLDSNPILFLVRAPHGWCCTPPPVSQRHVVIAVPLGTVWRCTGGSGATSLTHLLLSPHQLSCSTALAARVTAVRIHYSIREAVIFQHHHSFCSGCHSSTKKMLLRLVPVYWNSQYRKKRGSYACVLNSFLLFISFQNNESAG